MDPDKIDRAMEFILNQQARQAARHAEYEAQAQENFAQHRIRMDRIESAFAAMVASQNQLMETVTGLARVSGEFNQRQKATDERIHLLTQHMDQLALHMDHLTLRMNHMEGHDPDPKGKV